jgi:hypothetical protein
MSERVTIELPAGATNHYDIRSAKLEKAGTNFIDPRCLFITAAFVRESHSSSLETFGL